VFDREICEIVAMDPMLRSTVGELLTERHQSIAHEFIEELFTGQSRVRSQYKKTFEIVRMLATLGKVILVGRAAGFVTQDMPAGIHMRLVAPIDRRVKWTSKKFNVAKLEARERLIDQDNDRRKMVKTFFSKDVADPLNYDMVWNTDKTKPDEIVAAVLQLIKTRAQKP
jgi:cytidylate kinase